MQKGLPFSRFLLLLLLCSSFIVSSAKAQSVELYAPYTRITVTPGQKIDYSIKLINNSSSTRDVGISLYGLPDDWSYTLKSGGWQISRLSVLPDKEETISLEVMVPLKVKKGTYRFHLRASGYDDLPLTIEVSKSGTYKTAFSTKQPNLEGAANTTFTFSASLQNATADTQFYALTARPPRGWSVNFKASYKQVASVKVNPNETQSISIEVDPPDQTPAGTYKIPVLASTANTSAGFEVSVAITGSYDLSLSTPTGRLSEDITAGSSKEITLSVENTGSAPLTDITMSATTPVDWNVTFDPKKISRLPAGKTAEVTAKIHASEDAIAGDYVTALEAKTSETSSQAKFRISVHTSAIWGWLGIIIICAALGSVYYLFKKFGRR